MMTFPIAPELLPGGQQTPSSNSTYRIDADAEAIAMKFYADRVSPITHLDMYLDIAGTVTGTNFSLSVETDSSDAPSGTVLGAASAAFAGPAVDGWVGAQALATATGALTLNAPYWVVLRRVSGTSHHLTRR